MNYADCHCHLTDPRIYPSLKEKIFNAEKNGVTRFWLGGYDPLEWQLQKQLKSQLPQSITTAFGLHPWWVSEQTDQGLNEGLVALEAELAGADSVGELGLDFSEKWKGNSEVISRQKKGFLMQLALVKVYPKPLVLHLVRCHAESLRILKEKAPFSERGIVHSFSGDYASAKKYVDLGFLISISGAITKSNFKGLQETVLSLPVEFLILETDSPDQSPLGIGEGANEPAHLVKVAEVVAEKKKLSVDEVLDRSTRNFESLFNEK